MTHAEMGSTALWMMLLLGAYHGMNPGMGWLFAVGLGMQEQRGSAVAKSLVPIAVGHALAIGIVVLTVAFLGRAFAAPSPLCWSGLEYIAWLGIITRVGSACAWASET